MPDPAIWSAAACVAAPTNPTFTAPPNARAVVSASSAGLPSDPSASVCASKRMFSTLLLPHPGDEFACDLFRRHVLHDPRLAPLFGQRHRGETEPRIRHRRRLGTLQGRH